MITIALADDHFQMRGAIAGIIKETRVGQLIIEADNGCSLLMQLRSLREVPSIAIIDVNMPVMDGIAVAYFMHLHYPAIKIIGVSTLADRNVMLDLLDAGASAFIAKYNLSKLLPEAVAALTNNEFYLDASIAGTEERVYTRRKPQKKNSMLNSLSEKELMFLQLSATAISYDQIAELMHVGKASIYNYQKSLKEKLGIATRQELMLFAIQYGLARVARLNHAHVLF